MNTVIGTCSLCGGPVVVPHAWYGVCPPTPTCHHCGAVARQNHGPVIPMTNPVTIETTDKIIIFPNSHGQSHH